jgi:hypothetical protein
MKIIVSRSSTIILSPPRELANNYSLIALAYSITARYFIQRGRVSSSWRGLDAITEAVSRLGSCSRAVSGS